MKHSHKKLYLSLVSAPATRAVYQNDGCILGLCVCYPCSLPEPLSGICTGTLPNLNRYLHRNPPEPHQVSAPEPSGTSPGICTGTLQNLTKYLNRCLHRNPSGTLRGTWLKLHRIAPELIWAKDPIAKFCQWEKWSWIVVLVLSRNSTTVLHCITPMSWPRCF